MRVKSYRSRCRYCGNVSEGHLTCAFPTQCNPTLRAVSRSFAGRPRDDGIHHATRAGRPRIVPGATPCDSRRLDRRSRGLEELVLLLMRKRRGGTDPNVSPDRRHEQGSKHNARDDRRPDAGLRPAIGSIGGTPMPIMSRSPPGPACVLARGRSKAKRPYRCLTFVQLARTWFRPSRTHRSLSRRAGVQGGPIGPALPVPLAARVHVRATRST
jgi:hypothetical protein